MRAGGRGVGYFPAAFRAVDKGHDILLSEIQIEYEHIQASRTGFEHDYLVETLFSSEFQEIRLGGDGEAEDADVLEFFADVQEGLPGGIVGDEHELLFFRIKKYPFQCRFILDQDGGDSPVLDHGHFTDKNEVAVMDPGEHAVPFGDQGVVADKFLRNRHIHIPVFIGEYRLPAGDFPEDGDFFLFDSDQAGDRFGGFSGRFPPEKIVYRDVEVVGDAGEGFKVRFRFSKFPISHRGLRNIEEFGKLSLSQVVFF